VEAEGPRVVVFRVSGAIALKSVLKVRHPYLTMDGQHAPGEGITLRNHGISVRTHDVVLRYFRIRVGDEGVSNDVRYQAGEGEDALRFEAGAVDCIADHLSLGWTTGKVITTTLTSDRITIQWCILSESLNFAGHGYAVLGGGNRISWHHNLLAHNYSRNIRFQGALNADFRNNTIYDWGATAGYGEFDRVNYVGNYLKPGPSTTQRPRLFHRGDEVVLPGSIFVELNLIEGEPKVTEDNWRGMGRYYYDRDTLQSSAPFPAPPVAMQNAREAHERVLAESGDTRPVRDAVDQRVVREVKEGRGKIIQWVREAGK
jgi:pectate lyase